MGEQRVDMPLDPDFEIDDTEWYECARLPAESHVQIEDFPFSGDGEWVQSRRSRRPMDLRRNMLRRTQGTIWKTNLCVHSSFLQQSLRMLYGHAIHLQSSLAHCHKIPTAMNSSNGLSCLIQTA